MNTHVPDYQYRQEQRLLRPKQVWLTAMGNVAPKKGWKGAIPTKEKKA